MTLAQSADNPRVDRILSPDSGSKTRNFTPPGTIAHPSLRPGDGVCPGLVRCHTFRVSAAPRLKDETTESYDRHRSSPSRISPFTTFRTASRVVPGRPIHRAVGGGARHKPAKVNRNHNAADTAVPFGEFREFGVAREVGHEGLLNFLETRRIRVRPSCYLLDWVARRTCLEHEYGSWTWEGEAYGRCVDELPRSGRCGYRIGLRHRCGDKSDTVGRRGTGHRNRQESSGGRVARLHRDRPG